MKTGGQVPACWSVLDGMDGWMDGWEREALCGFDEESRVRGGGMGVGDDAWARNGVSGDSIAYLTYMGCIKGK